MPETPPSEVALPSGGDPSVLRRLNLRAVLRLLHQGGVHTISELARGAQLSRPTAKQAVDDLVASGWVGPAEPRREPVLGRPAQAFAFRPEVGYVLGAEIGEHRTLVLVADMDGEVVGTARRDAGAGDAPAERLSALAAAIDEAVALLPTATVLHGTVTTSGTVDGEGLVVFDGSQPEWVGQNPRAWLEDRYPFPVCGATDTAMAALAERWRGAAQSAQDVLYARVGRRIGTAALIGGRPHRGRHGAAAQFALWRGAPWRADYDAMLHVDDAEGRRDIFAASADGDPAAAERVAEFVDEFVDGLAPMLITLDPELVVIASEVPTAGDLLSEAVRERISTQTPFPPSVVSAALGDEAVALGAIRVSLDHAEERLYAELAPAQRG